MVDGESPFYEISRIYSYIRFAIHELRRDFLYRHRILPISPDWPHVVIFGSWVSIPLCSESLKLSPRSLFPVHFPNLSPNPSKPIINTICLSRSPPIGNALLALLADPSPRYNKYR